jgi:hypothetical protein
MGSVAMGSVAMGSVAMGSVAMGSVAMGSVAMGSVAMGSVAKGSVAKGSVAKLTVVQREGYQNKHRRPLFEINDIDEWCLHMTACDHNATGRSLQYRHNFRTVYHILFGYLSPPFRPSLPEIPMAYMRCSLHHFHQNLVELVAM